ncbi:hypothetical protein TSUD_270620 [Trifolium subterraneum]|uniref:Apple domain-containing protein n=1 Tax=Trifolium subterraneum TaxID=3900 RepID=A0A2Z6P679_TRISU|nr:hypothetical protein TSUD_270620 [Trifolium subterraneum]
MEDNRFVILNLEETYWESEEYGMMNLNAKFDDLDDISSAVYNLLVNFTTSSYVLSNTRLFLDSTGVIQWVKNLLEGDSPVLWKQPRSKCLRYNVCGNFASCNDDDDVPCKCLPGFYNDNVLGDGHSSLQDTDGCKRRKPTSCPRNDVAFLNMTMIKTRRPDSKITAESEEDCQSICLGRCTECQAYSYAPPVGRGLISSNCWIWNNSLTTLKEEYTYPRDDDRRLIVLVDKSDIERTPRTCEPCGTNIVPYPLSTGSNCGDHKYFNFACNNATSQLSFKANNNISYTVIRVEPNTNFVVKDQIEQDILRFLHRFTGIILALNK